jgi:hypothetical protein
MGMFSVCSKSGCTKEPGGSTAIMALLWTGVWAAGTAPSMLCGELLVPQWAEDNRRFGRRPVSVSLCHWYVVPCWMYI